MRRCCRDEPPLLENESEFFYNELWDAVVADVKPATFLEFVAVKDYVDKLHEELRYKAPPPN